MKFTIKEKHSISQSRKDVEYGTGDPYDPNNPDSISEWAVAVAFSHYSIGDVVDSEELEEKIQEAMALQVLNQMVDDGLIVMSLGKDNEPVYSLKQ